MKQSNLAEREERVTVKKESDREKLTLTCGLFFLFFFFFFFFLFFFFLLFFFFFLFFSSSSSSSSSASTGGGAAFPRSRSSSSSSSSTPSWCCFTSSPSGVSGSPGFLPGRSPHHLGSRLLGRSTYSAYFSFQTLSSLSLLHTSQPPAKSPILSV